MRNERTKNMSNILLIQGDYKTVTKRVGGGYSSFAYPNEDFTANKPKTTKKEPQKIRFLGSGKRKSWEDLGKSELPSQDDKGSRVFSPNGSSHPKLIRKKSASEKFQKPTSESYSIIKKGINKFYSLRHRKDWQKWNQWGDCNCAASRVSSARGNSNIIIAKNNNDKCSLWGNKKNASKKRGNYQEKSQGKSQLNDGGPLKVEDLSGSRKTSAKSNI